MRSQANRLQAVDGAQREKGHRLLGHAMGQAAELASLLRRRSMQAHTSTQAYTCQLRLYSTSSTILRWRAGHGLSLLRCCTLADTPLVSYVIAPGSQAQGAPTTAAPAPAPDSAPLPYTTLAPPAAAASPCRSPCHCRWQWRQHSRHQRPCWEPCIPCGTCTAAAPLRVPCRQQSHLSGAGCSPPSIAQPSPHGQP